MDRPTTEPRLEWLGDVAPQPNSRAPGASAVLVRPSSKTFGGKTITTRTRTRTRRKRSGWSSERRCFTRCGSQLKWCYARRLGASQRDGPSSKKQPKKGSSGKDGGAQLREFRSWRRRRSRPSRASRWPLRHARPSSGEENGGVVDDMAASLVVAIVGREASWAKTRRRGGDGGRLFCHPRPDHPRLRAGALQPMSYAWRQSSMGRRNETTGGGLGRRDSKNKHDDEDGHEEDIAKAAEQQAIPFVMLSSLSGVASQRN